ncbi:MAG: hypothetical protein MJ219_04820 [Mycoplasmoidaceae bacterium]|nr:hypothetical protein [Mycoplasmoidaceae bacterium]
MKDNKKIRKVIFIGKSNIALVIFNEIDGHKNILFANQVSIDADANLQGKISELLTLAANFLGFNIKDVEMVFDDEQITRYSFYNAEFVDCNSEEDIAKEIFKKAKIDNYFVNEINFLGINYDEIDKVAKVNCDICASDYITYKKYIKILKDCGLTITNSTNLYKLLKGNRDEIELTIKINGNHIIACEYYGNKLNNVKSIELNMDEIKSHISEKFNISFDKIDNVLSIANQLSATKDVDVEIVNNYYLKTKTYNKVKAADIIALYKGEIRTQINNYIDCRNFQSVLVVSDQTINALDEFQFYMDEQIGLETISLDKLISLSNIDMNQNQITQFSFENKISHINLLV